MCTALRVFVVVVPQGAKSRVLCELWCYVVCTLGRLLKAPLGPLYRTLTERNCKWITEMMRRR